MQIRRQSQRLVFAALVLFSIAGAAESLLAGSAAQKLAPVGRQTKQSATAAASEPAMPLHVEQALNIALEENYDLKAIRSASASLKFRARQALSPNSPTFTYYKNDLDGFTPGGQPYSEQYVVSYTLGFPGKALSNSSAIRHQGESAQEDSISKEIDVMVLLESNFAAQYANREMDRILTVEVQNAKSLIRLQQTRYASALAAQADIMGSRVNLFRLQQTLLSNTNEFAALQNDFTNLLGRPVQHYIASFDEVWASPKSLPSEARMNELMTANRPSLKSLARLAQSFESALTSSRLAALPDLTFSMGVNQYSNPATAPVSGLGHSYNLGISIAVPLFFPFNEYQGLRAARSDLSAADSRMKATQVQAASDLATAYVNYKALVEEVDQLQQTVIPAAKSYYDLGLAAYSAGRSDFLRLNDARAIYLSAQFDFISKTKQLQMTFYQLVQLVGCDFTKSAGLHACE